MAITTQALDILDAAGLGRALFAEVDPNPNEQNLAAGLAAYKAGGHDGVVAFGGGSGLDLAKMVAFMAGQTRPVWDFEDIGDWWTRADPAGIAPIVAVPTTAGTGSEVGRASVITNSETHVKKIIFHPKVLPSVVIMDPELTVGMPKWITAGTGMDAFAHCLEAYSSPFYHPMSQGIALEGLRLVNEYLPRAYADGTDLEARANMMSAAAMGAVAFQKGLGAIHALSHPVGAVYNTHHGTTNAVVMPAVLRFNRPGGRTPARGGGRLSRDQGGLRRLRRPRGRTQRHLRDPEGPRRDGGRGKPSRRPHRHGARGPERGREPGRHDEGEYARAVPRRDVRGRSRWPRPQVVPQARRAASRATSPMLSREIPRSARSRSVRTDSSS
jgi:alcohol dehydrogenase class IV